MSNQVNVILCAIYRNKKLGKKSSTNGYLFHTGPNNLPNEAKLLDPKIEHMLLHKMCLLFFILNTYYLPQHL